MLFHTRVSLSGFKFIAIGLSEIVHPVRVPGWVGHVAAAWCPQASYLSTTISNWGHGLLVVDKLSVLKNPNSALVLFTKHSWLDQLSLKESMSNFRFRALELQREACHPGSFSAGRPLVS